MSKLIAAADDTTQDKLIMGALNAGLAPLLNGDPGIGKTASVRDLAERHNFYVIDIIGGRKDPAFVEGLPIVKHTDKDGKPLHMPYTITTKPDWFRDAVAIAKGGMVYDLDLDGEPLEGTGRSYDGVILFFDEFRSTLEDVQAALLSFIQDRRLDGISLPDNVHIILAANPVTTGANGQYIAPPMANRLIHIDFEVPVEQWLRLLPQNFGKQASEAEYVEFARGAAYLNNNHSGTGIVTTVVPSDPAKADGAYPSRRSWVNVFRLLAAVGPDRATRDQAMIATVGEDAALAFKQWDETLNLPSFEEVLRSYETLDWKNFTTDKVYAIIVMATNMATAENMENVAKVLVKVGDFHEALAALQGRELLTRSRKIGMTQDAAMSIARILSDRFRDILSDASGVPTPRRA
jgi:MoxR-like ATPase